MFSSLPDTYFFTATINNWQSLLLPDERKQIIINSLKYCCNTQRILLHAFVIMPNHIHLIITLPEEDKRVSFQRDFLKFTSQQLIKSLILNKNTHDELKNYLSSQSDRKFQIWERRAKWIPVVNTLILEQKIEYLHRNPLQDRWKLAETPEQYYWSSASYYILNESDFEFITHYF